MVAEEFVDIGGTKLAKAREQQIAIAELEGRDGQHGLRLVGKASGAQHPRSFDLERRHPGRENGTPVHKFSQILCGLRTEPVTLSSGVGTR